jgi:hypothetical protein
VAVCYATFCPEQPQSNHIATMHFSHTILSLYLVISAAIAIPAQSKTGRTRQLQQPFPALGVFDPALAVRKYITNEKPLTDAYIQLDGLNKVRNKYVEQAAMFFRGEGIVPENDIVDWVSTQVTNFTEQNTGMANQALSSPVIGQSLPLTDDIGGGVDVSYYGEGGFGTPKAGAGRQVLSFIVDTGSADLWLPSGCAFCTGRQFNTKSSETYRSLNKPFSIQYVSFFGALRLRTLTTLQKGSGSARGMLGQDKVSMNNLEIESQVLGLVNDESDDFIDGANDGLFGLAFGTIAQSRSPTFIENLIKARKIRPLFSIHLTRGVEKGSEARIFII